MSETVIEKAEVVEDFISSMKWTDSTSDEVKALVEMNVRGFWAFIHRPELDGCQQAIDEAFQAAWHCSAIIRGIPVFVCADEFVEDLSVGIPSQPSVVWAVRKDDSTAFELLDAETAEYFSKAAEEYEPGSDFG